MSVQSLSTYANTATPLWLSSATVLPPGPTGPTGPTGSIATGIYISAFSSTDQTLSAGFSTPINYEAVSVSNGISPVLPYPTPLLQVSATGVYRILYSVQVLSASNTLVEFYLTVNGTPVPDTTSAWAVKNNDEVVLTCEYLQPLNAGDTFSIVGYSTTGTVVINAIPAGATPLAPGIITNVFRIA